MQLGDGTNTARNTPPSADVLTSVASIAGGRDHTCALTTSGGLRCWGRNVNGQASVVHACCLVSHIELRLYLIVVQLGDGTATDRNTPPLVDVLTSVAAIAAGWHHTCALTTSGGVRCWGRNDQGQASAVHACCLSLHVI